MKTPEELAEAYCKKYWDTHPETFIDGYEVGFAQGKLLAKEEFNQTLHIAAFDTEPSYILIALFCGLSFVVGLLLGAAG
jgi:hypothetical protein